MFLKEQYIIKREKNEATEQSRKNIVQSLKLRKAQIQNQFDKMKQSNIF